MWWWHHCDVIKLAINLEQANSTHGAYGQCALTCVSAFLACVWRESAGTTRNLCCGLGKAPLEQLVPVCGRLLHHYWRWKARRRSLKEGLGASIDQKKSTGRTRTRRHAQDQKRRRSSRRHVQVWRVWFFSEEHTDRRRDVKLTYVDRDGREWTGSMEGLSGRQWTAVSLRGSAAMRGRLRAW
jgi:hypothetical protein